MAAIDELKLFYCKTYYLNKKFQFFLFCAHSSAIRKTQPCPQKSNFANNRQYFQVKDK